jgi:hypothetical protein
MTPVKPGQSPEGYGALRGHFIVRPGPIYEQVLELDKKERRKSK